MQTLVLSQSVCIPTQYTTVGHGKQEGRWPPLFLLLLEFSSTRVFPSISPTCTPKMINNVVIMTACLLFICLYVRMYTHVISCLSLGPQCKTDSGVTG